MPTLLFCEYWTMLRYRLDTPPLVAEPADFGSRSSGWRTETPRQRLYEICSHSGRIGPDTPSKAPAASSATRSRAGSTGPGMPDAPGRNALEAELAVIRLVADQDHQPVALRARLAEGAFDQGLADAAVAERRLHGQRPEQQRPGLADAHRRQPHRADEQRADMRGERQVEAMSDLLAQPIGGLGMAAGPERALMQALDRDRVVALFRQDAERDVGHGARA